MSEINVKRSSNLNAHVSHSLSFDQRRLLAVCQSERNIPRRNTIENNSKFVRGKKRVREDIESLVQRQFTGRRLNDCEYRLIISYDTEADLKEQIDELFTEVYQLADLRNCTAEDVSIKHELTGAYWREYNGGWDD